MERLDKIVASQTEYSRKEIKKLIAQGKITANGEKVLRPEQKFDMDCINIVIDDKPIEVNRYVYLIMNKPKGYVSATEDKNDKTVLDLVPSKYKMRNLFPVGRLDKDTTGMMIISDDGEFAHNILSPKKHIIKTYRVKIDIDINEKMKEDFKRGIVLKDHVCCPAEIIVQDKNTALVKITEGKYHQIKRMFGCFGAKVVELDRISMGKLDMPVDLKMGECRELTEVELQLLKLR